MTFTLKILKKTASDSDEKKENKAEQKLQEVKQETLQRWLYLPRLLVLLWQVDRKDMLLQLMLAIGIGCIPILQLELINLFVNNVIDLIAGKQHILLVVLLLLLLVVSFLAGNVTRALNELRGRDIQDRLMTRIQDLLLRKAGNLSLRSFENAEAFDSLERARQGLDRQLFTPLFNILSAFIAVIGTLAFVAFGSPFFPLILLVGTSAGLPARFIGQKLRYQWNRQKTNTERTLNNIDFLITLPMSAAEVRLFHLEDHFLALWKRTYDLLRSTNLKMARAQMKTTFIADSIQWLTYSLVLIGTVLLASSGVLSLGGYAAYIASVDRFQFNLWMLFMGFSSMDDDLRYIGDFFEYLDIKDEDIVVPASHSVGTLSSQATSGESIPRIVFEAVSFAYPGAPCNTLTDIQLTIEPGERLALVGENGAGKTTFTKLLLGLYHPTSGRITIDGIDLRELDPTTWWQRCSAVFQNYIKYEATARENIGFGFLPELDNAAQLQYAAKRSGSNEIIQQLPLQYETRLGKMFDDNGQDLSEGQWQKFVIARAFFRPSQVIVLDEPTSALDAKAELEVFKHFSTLSQEKSTLFISHRLGTARIADRIIVLQEGRIVENGTHDELIKNKGIYANMLKLQSQWYES